MEEKVVKAKVKAKVSEKEAKVLPSLEKVIAEPAKESVTVEITAEEIKNLKNIHDYLHSRPMNETEGGVFFMRQLLNKIQNA